MNALIAHRSALLSSRGVPSASAAIALSMYGSSAIVGRLTWTAYAIGGAIGPVLLGHAFDSSGAYTASMDGP